METKHVHIFSIIMLVLTTFFVILTIITRDIDGIGFILGTGLLGGISWPISIKHIRKDLAWKKAPDLTANVEVTNITSVVGGTSLSVSTSFHVRFDFLDLDVNQVFPLDANEKGGVMEGEQGVLTYKHLTTKKGDFVRFISFQPK